MMRFRLDRFLIRASGPDARALLQDLLTQNLDRLTPAAPIYAGLLTPQGKVIADMNLWDEGGALLIETDPARGPDLLRRLNMFKLRRQANFEAIERTIVYSPTAFEGAAPDPRMPDGELGWRAISNAAEELPDGSEIYQELRLRVGVPDLAVDAQPEEVFALEALFEELNGVDFHKGCFVGQENASRMKRRATTRRKFCPLEFETEAPAPGAALVAGEAELGAIRARSGPRALALLRLDRARAALSKGETLKSEGLAARLAPPAWLILPSDKDDAP